MNLEQASQKYSQFQINKWQNTPSIFRKCAVCNTQFDAQSFIFRKTAIYPLLRNTCSEECRKIYRIKRTKDSNSIDKLFSHCQYCGKELTHRLKSNASRPRQKFCCHQCYSNSIKGRKAEWVSERLSREHHKFHTPSIQEAEWLDKYPNITNRQHRVVIQNKAYFVDGFDSNSNTIFEYLGSFWHGNPSKYDPEDTNPVNGKKYKDLYTDTVNRLNTFRDAGYNVVFEWSS